MASISFFEPSEKVSVRRIMNRGWFHCSNFALATVTQGSADLESTATVSVWALEGAGLPAGVAGSALKADAPSDSQNIAAQDVSRSSRFFINRSLSRSPTAAGGFA